MKQNIKPVKIALDSDMLRNLAYFCRTNNKTHNLMNNQHVYHNIDSYYYLLSCIYDNTIELFIGKTVYKENKHSQEILDFIDEYNIKLINAPIEQVKTIADIYCNSYKDKLKINKLLQ